MAGQEDEADRNDEDKALQDEGNGISHLSGTGDDEDADVLKYDAEERRIQQNEGCSLTEKECQAAESAAHDGDYAGADRPRRARPIERLLLPGERGDVRGRKPQICQDG